MRSTKRILQKFLNSKLVAYSHQEKKRKFYKIVQTPEVKQPIIYPNQYPNYSLTNKDPIISRQRPVRHVTPKFQIPEQKMMGPEMSVIQQKYKGEWKSPENAYILNVGLIGPINAGKSQLFGALAHKISAVSPKASTTTEIIMGVKSFQCQSQQGLRNIQIKYYDTPGLMYKKQGFISKGWKVLSSIDFSLLVVDSAKRFDDMIKQSIKRLEKHRDYPNFMKALVLNKIDLVDNRRKFDQLIRQIQKYGKFDKIFYVSAKTGYGINQLQQYLQKMAKPGQWQYPPEVKTDRTELQICQQMLRQAIFNRTYKQLPHITDVQCISFSQLTNKKMKIIFNVFVGSQNQQRMIIGLKGKNLKQIIDEFKLQYAKMYGQQADPLISIKIRNSFRDRFPGRQQVFVDTPHEETQKLKVLSQNLQGRRSTGVFRNLVTVSKQSQQLKTTNQQKKEQN